VRKISITSTYLFEVHLFGVPSTSRSNGQNFLSQVGFSGFSNFLHNSAVTEAANIAKQTTTNEDFR